MTFIPVLYRVCFLPEWIAEDNNELKDDAPQDKKYIHICNQTGTIPSSFFLRHIKDSKFRMRYHGLGPMGAKAIALPLKVESLCVHHDLITLILLRTTQGQFTDNVDQDKTPQNVLSDLSSTLSDTLFHSRGKNNLKLQCFGYCF